MPQTATTARHRRVMDTTAVAKWLSTATRVLKHLLSRIRQEFRIRGEIARAMALDDRTLADISISRGDIARIVRHGRSTDRSRSD